MNPLNPLRFTSHQKNWEKLSFKFLNDKIDKAQILPNCQVPNSFFGITINFIIKKFIKRVRRCIKMSLLSGQIFVMKAKTRESFDFVETSEIRLWNYYLHQKKPDKNTRIMACTLHTISIEERYIEEKTQIFVVWAGTVRADILGWTFLGSQSPHRWQNMSAKVKWRIFCGYQ